MTPSHTFGPGFITKQFALAGGVLLGGGIITSHLSAGVAHLAWQDGLDTHQSAPIPWTMRAFLYEDGRHNVQFLGHAGVN